MMNKSSIRLCGMGLLLVTCLCGNLAVAQEQTAGKEVATLKVEPAAKNPYATRAAILGAARAGSRVIGVGDYGTVLLSDDGKKFAQAASVPISATLTAVAFSDEKNGWAVGHWGSILSTTNGGENWSLLRTDMHEDRPLFSVHFFDAQHGLVVGLWSLMLVTDDAGKTWQPVNLPPPPEGGKADRNLFKIFVSSKGTTFVAAERGVVLRSDNHGKTWQYVNTGYKGSFWTGVGLKDGTLLMAGLRGTIYRSTDDGLTWQPANSGVKSSITDILEVGTKVVAVGLDGVEVESVDGGGSWTNTQRGDRLSMTALATGGEGVVRFSKKGVVQSEK